MAAAKQLIERANASGGPDNITAIVIQVSDESSLKSVDSTEASPKILDLDDTHPSLQVQR
jgi:serine/threonine protein phosphatase PrpC